MRVILIIILSFVWFNQLFFLIDNFGVLRLVYFLFLTYTSLVLIGMFDNKKFIFKSFLIPTIICIIIIITSYLGNILNDYIYLVLDIILYIFLAIFPTLTFKRSYLTNLIDNFVNDDNEAKKELIEFKNLINYFEKENIIKGGKKIEIYNGPVKLDRRNKKNKLIKK